MNENVGMAMLLGAFFKHVVPSNKVNRFIPFVNMAVMTGMNIARGMDVGQAVIGGITDSVMASGAHKVVKTTVLGDARFIPARDGERRSI